MIRHHNPDDVIARLVHWANQNDAIRAMLLTSTQAQPDATTDVLSDYDVVLVVVDIHPFFNNRAWLGEFGEVLVTYWDPIYPEPDYGMEQTGNVVQYADGLKIDFRMWPIELMQRMARAPTLIDELDAGYRVLLDKDGLAEGMPAPTFRAYIPSRPSEQAYQIFVEEFFSDAPYVAKCLWRDDLLPAKWCLDYDMKHVYLRQMLEWWLEREHGWALPVRNMGKGLKELLPAELWHQLERTYAGGGSAENWEALIRTVALFRSLAIKVADDLGYSYPAQLDQRVMEYVQAIRSMEL